jgi:C-terminal processing protease CtpA/Prc
MAFSIPIDKCITLMPGLLTDAGYYKFTLGMNVDARSVGMVTNVVSGTPAEVAGVKVGDRVINVDSKTVNLGLDFWTYLIDLKPGTAVRLTLKRGKADINTTVILGAPK